jgi:tRNA threonylcarbamoyladenosine biosynthesis protein TsaB
VSLLLHIDTAVDAASVCLSSKEEVIGVTTNLQTKESAAWIQPAIQQLMEEHGQPLQQLKAISVSAGPGSYTGLRVGMATAKGLCYALHIPLITINTLQMMAAAATAEPTNLLCPMIDARRMEVFTAVYKPSLELVVPSKALILEENSFAEFLEKHTITFFGNGSTKFNSVMEHANAVFKTIPVNASHLTVLAYQQFVHGNFADLAYCEPFYGKEFYSPVKTII